jgi:23S rRNA (uracil1939-C5)-methyltransferase
VSQSCGGCQWLEAPYDLQLQWKEGFVLDAIRRIGKIQLSCPVSMTGSDHPNYYRNRVTLRGTIDSSGKVAVGYFMEESRTQVHVESCWVASAAINGVISRFQTHVTKAPCQKFRLELQDLPASASHKKPSILATVIPVEKHGPMLSTLVEEIRSFPEIAWAGLVSDQSGAPYSVFEVDGPAFFTAPGRFQQINTHLNHLLRRHVEAIVVATHSQSIFDLFCGSGNLSLRLADGQRKIWGVEFDRGAIKVAKHNVRHNALNNINFEADDATKWLEQKASEGIRPDLVITDPPRRGMKELVPALGRLAPAHIIYVSCDPNTLARDLKDLARDYEIRSVRMFDFFPNTFHVETAVHLARR